MVIVFENRFPTLEEKCAEWACNSEIIRDTARSCWWATFAGAEVLSTDLRASAALILTGLVH